MTVLVGLLNGMISAATPLLLSSLGGGADVLRWNF